MTRHRLCPTNPEHGPVQDWPTDRWGFYCPAQAHDGRPKSHPEGEAPVSRQPGLHPAAGALRYAPPASAAASGGPRRTAMASVGVTIDRAAPEPEQTLVSVLMSLEEARDVVAQLDIIDLDCGRPDPTRPLGLLRSSLERLLEPAEVKA